MSRLRAISGLMLAMFCSPSCSPNDEQTESHPDSAVDTMVQTDSITPIDTALATDSSESGATDSNVAIDASDTADAADGPKVGTYIDANAGHDDTGDGTYLKPFLTVKKGASVATTSGQTIYAFPGTYSLDVAATNIADGVGIEALTYGTVTFAPSAATGNSFGITFQGSGFIHGVLMNRAFINVSAGTVKLDGVQSGGIGDPGAGGQSAINVSSTGHVVITPGGLTNYIVPGLSSYVDLRGLGQVEVMGGAIVDAGRNTFEAAALFNLAGSSKLVLDGVTIDRAKTGAVQFSGTSSVTLQGGTLVRASAQATGATSQSINSNNGSATLVIDNSTVTGSPYAGITVNVGAATPSITLRNGAVVEKCASTGILAAGTLTLDNARVSDNVGTGVDLESGTLVTSAGTVVRNNAKGIELRLPNAFIVTMRNTQVINNTGIGIAAQYKDGAKLDFGTAASLGGNTFTGNGTSNVTFNGGLTTGDLTINAVGNTWDPTGNGADSTGHFATGTTFKAPPSVSGPNLNLLQSGSATYHASLVVAP